MIPWLYGATRWAVWAIVETCCGFRTVGRENVPRTGPLIVACNHVSNLDPPCLGVGMPRPVTYMAKKELFEIPLLGPLIGWLGAFPVDRSRGDVASIKTAIGVLERGTCLGIFPRGRPQRRWNEAAADGRCPAGIALGGRGRARVPVGNVAGEIPLAGYRRVR